MSYPISNSPAPEIAFYEGDDIQKLAVRRWQCDEPLADVVFLHGIVSHGGWYESSCSFLAKNSFCVHFLERRGSGLNPDNRGDVDSWQTWLSDVNVYLATLTPGRPKILIGISWGGVLAAAIARQRSDLIDGLGLICPGLFSSRAANAWQRLAIQCASAMGFGQVKVDIPLKDPALFTNSAHHQAYVRRDPLTLRRITIRFAVNNLKLLRFATEQPDAIRVPVLLMLASRDPVTLNQETSSFVERTGHPDREVIQYQDASHTLEFEDDPSQYQQDLVAWCRRIVKQSND